jgi:hypothetical protein
MARLEKRRMAESATHPSPTATTLKTPPASNLLANGLPTTQHNTNEIENLLFKQEHDAPTHPNQTYSVTLPENILLSQGMTNSIAHYSASIKRQHTLDDHLEQATNGALSPHKKARLGLNDDTKLTQVMHPATTKSGKKNRNKQQTTITKTATSGVFPQQQQQQQHQHQHQQPLQHTMTVQNTEESSDDVSRCA